MSTLRLFLAEIRIEHTLFALPFAYVGAILAAHGMPSAAQLFWITLAVLGARTAAMAANRYIDRDIDARNPRTARRGLPKGVISPRVMVGGIVVGLLVLAVSAFALNPLCVTLLPIAGAGILLYPFCKRFTWGTHFFLGACDGLAPLGAYIAVAGTIRLPALLLFIAVTIWVAGFDIIYALMDREIDLAQSLRSVPARFGVEGGRRLALALHVLLLPLLLALGLLTHAHSAYYLGAFSAPVLAWYERSLFHTGKDIFAVNDCVFSANMLFSALFLITTLAGSLLS